MSTISSSALATVQAKRFSARTQGNMRKRGVGHGIAFGGGGGGGGRASLYKQMYGNDGRNGVNRMIEFDLISDLFLIRK